MRTNNVFELRDDVLVFTSHSMKEKTTLIGDVWVRHCCILTTYY